MSNSGKSLSLFSLIILTVGSVASVRNLPTIALLGDSLIFFFTMATIFFLLPITLVTSKLSRILPHQGGIYIWARHAFGKKIGFLAIWFQWIGNIIWFPTILSFAAATIGYLINPLLIDNKLFITTTVIIIFWGTTIINLFGMKFSSRINNFCTIAGLFLPILLIIGIGIAWFNAGNISQLHFTAKSFLPDYTNSKMWIALTGMIMSFCGLEIATVHANDVKEPHKTFPIALVISTTILALILFLGSIIVACIIPRNNIDLLAGMMQTFQTFSFAFHLNWLMPTIAVILVLGSIGSISNWIIAPLKGLSVATSETKHLKHFAKSNKHDAPHNLLVYQAIVVTLLMIVFLGFPSVKASYWLLTTLATQLFMLMYILLFITGLFLHFKYPAKKHHSIILKTKNIGMVIICLFGIIGTLVTICIGFLPPSNLAIGSTLRYETIFITGLIITILPPFLIHKKSKEEIEETLAIDLKIPN